MTLEERLARIERQNRWHKLLTAAALLAVVGMSVWVWRRTEPTSSTVRTHRLEIVDSQGQVRAELGWVGEEGDRVGLALRSKNKVVAVVSTSANEDGHTALALCPPQFEAAAVRMHVDAEGDYGFSIHGRQHGGVAVTHGERGGAVLTVNGSWANMNKIILRTPVPELEMFNDKGEPVLRLPAGKP